MKRFKGDWILYLILSVVSIALGIILLVNNYKIGLEILNIAIAIMLVIYLAVFLFPIIKNKQGKMKVLTIVEFVLICIIAVGLVLQQFKVFNIVGACKIIGLVIWLRAVVELFRAYFYRGSENGKKYASWYFCLMIVLITAGTFMFAKPFFTDKQAVLALSIICFIIAIVLISFGIAYAPKSKRKR